MKTFPRFGFAITLLSLTTLWSCASGVKKVDFEPGTDPQAKLTEAQGRLKADQDKQYDLLSPSQFKKASESLTQARQLSEKGKPAADVLNELGNAVAHLQQGEANAQAHQSDLGTVLKARQDAVAAKANVLMPEKFADVDSDLKSMGSDIESNSFKPTSKEVSKLEGRYADVELMSVKKDNLGKAQAMIEKAQNDDASSNSPRTLAEARVKFDSAVRSIEANRRNPDGYRQSVADANVAADKLNQVNHTVIASKSSEAAAIQIYDQKQQLATTTARLNQTEQEAASAAAQAAAQAAATSDKLNAANAQNEKYADKAALNAKIEAIKGEFTPQEAEVVRDGNKIIVRLKSMQFTTAQSEIKPASLATLQKVKEMIEAVPLQKVVVEGHTDSVGGEALNMKLSQKRADAIKTYLVAEKTVTDDKVFAEGFGYERPLASNKTAAGRATNRRVDVVIETTMQ